MSPAPVTDRVDVAPLREAFEASGLTLCEVCRRLGWYATRAHPSRPSDARTPDVSRLKRALGMAPNIGSGPSVGARYTSHRIGYDLAARIAEAIGVDAYEVGL